MKKILIIILLISFDLSAQNEIIVEQSWSQPDKLPFNIMDGLYFTKIDGKYYAEFETLQDESVYYPDIERSLSHAQFFEINQDLQVQIVSDSVLSENLFLKTDFRTEWSPLIQVERGYNTVDDVDGNWRHNWEISCHYEGETFTHNFSYTSAPNKWYGVRSSLVSDEKGYNAVFLGETCLEGFFAKVYFIHFRTENKTFEIIEKNISYEDLDFNASIIQSVTNYADHEFRLEEKCGLFYRFNLDNSSAVGLTTFLFDVNKNEINIYSQKVDSTIFPILKDFNQVEAEIQVTGNTINYFVNLSRSKIGRGEDANTTLDPGSGIDVLFLKFENESYSEIQNFTGTNNAFYLQKTIKLKDEFIFIYDKKPVGLKIDQEVVIGNDSKFKLWIVQFSPNKTNLYEIGLNYLKLDKSINETYYSFVESNNSEIEIIAFLNGGMFEPTKHYLIGTINITANELR